MRAARVSTNNPFKNVQSLEEAERVLREVLGAEAGTPLENLSTSGKAMNAQMSSTATTEENGTAASERYMKATKLSTIVITKHTPGNRDAVRIIVRIHVSPWLHEYREPDT